MPIQDSPNVKSQIAALVPTVISKEIEFKASENGFRQFRNFVVFKQDLTKQPGDSVSIPKIDDLPSAQDLSETSVLRGSGRRLSISSITITPTEKGDEVQYSEYSKLTSQAELQDVVVELLARQSSKKENLDIRDVMFNAPRVHYQGGKATPAEAGKLSYADIDYVVEELEAAEAPKFGTGGNEHYVAFIHPYAKTALIDALRGVADYANSVPSLYSGEVGMYNRTRFIETAYCPFRAYIKGVPVATNIVVATGAVPAAVDAHAKTETYTITAASTTSLGVKNAAGALVKVFVGSTEKDAFTLTEIGAGAIKLAGIGATAALRLANSPVTLPAEMFTEATQGGTYVFNVQRNICSKVMGMRHVAFGEIKPVSMLGVEEFDYGRVIGIAWNAFNDSKVLNDEYGWVIESKR